MDSLIGEPRGLGAAVSETHISVLVFLGDHVYKIRKPVQFGFLDFTDEAARARDCEREVELNRRFAPDVYLGVVDVVDRGRAIDHAVVMRRLPDDRRLSRIGDRRAAVRDVARQMADFDAYALRTPEIDAAATRDAVAAAWEQNFVETAPFVGAILDEAREAQIRALVAQFLHGREALFASRIAAGMVRDGHGDLQADDIFVLDDGVRILDCVEFDDRLRFGDVLADLCFLAMDLSRLGAPGDAALLLRSYEEFTGHMLPRPLADHYCAARAYVRTKVACLAAAAGVEAAAVRARRLHALCASFLERSRPKLVLVGGLPGTGKSTVAAAIAARHDMTVLRTDEVRKEVTSDDDVARYTAAATDATYDRVLERAAAMLALGESVVVDATFSDARHRTAARAVAESSAECIELRCDLPAARAAGRIVRRLAAGGDPSDATPAVAAAMAARADPWPEAAVIDTRDRRAADRAARAAVGAVRDRMLPRWSERA